MILLDVQLFLGRFHPLLVHLPVGFLLLAALLQLAGAFERYRSIRSAVPISLLVGCISAIFACITGYLLSLGGDYNHETLSWHMWLGIITALLSFIAWLISIKVIPVTILQNARGLNIAVLIILVFVSVAGHYGGNLTHGSGYISADLLFKNKKEKKKITNAEEALVYEDIVEPILQNKCGSCHNNDKKKGQLSMETLVQLQKGGKHGAVLKEGKPLESELIKRVLLDPKDEKFMPTDGKPPLTTEERAIVQWWIEKQMTGADKKLAAAAPPDTIKQYIVKYLGASPATGSVTAIAATTISAPALKDEALAQLKKEGFVIKQISYAPDLLDVTLPASENDPGADRIKALEPIKDNILWLNIAGNQVKDEQLSVIKNFSNLQRLRLDNNPVTDNGIKQLFSLDALESLNLCYTNISNACLSDLSKMKNLQKVYVWGTSAKAGTAGSLEVISGSGELAESPKK
ncbi:MAG: DUF2231 domain-containing protein [Agriterribacter sp.]